MPWRKASGVAAIVLASLAPPQIRAQQPAVSLAVVDRIAIHQLVARYAYALDDAVDGGDMLAGLFLPDGVLRTPEAIVAGSDDLAAFARERTAAQTATLVTNIVIEGAGDRATGRVYVIEARVADETGGTLSAGGLFLDEYVRTSGGWRFARREFVRSRSTRP